MHAAHAPRLRSSAALALTLVACGPAKPPQEVDGWALARAALVDGESCYAERPAYCIQDPAFVDAALQAALDRRFDGQMPKFDKQVEQVIRSARINYENASQEPEGLAQITELVAANYAAPPVDTSVEGIVNVELGALPGELAVYGRVPTIVLSKSPLIEDFWWQGAEARRVLAKYAEAHPQAEVVRVEVDIPKGTGSDKHLIYRYFRETERVAFGQREASSLYLGAPTSLADMRAGKLALGKDARESCSKPKSGPSSSWCPYQDRFLEAERRR